MTDSTNEAYDMAIRFISSLERARARVGADYEDNYYYGAATGYLLALDNNKLVNEVEYKALFTRISYLKPSVL